MAKKDITINIGGVIFSLKTLKTYKEKEFKESWGKFLTISPEAAWSLVLKFIEENSKKKK